MDVDLSAEVAARLNLKDKDPALPVATGFCSRPASQADFWQAEEEHPRLTKVS